MPGRKPDKLEIAQMKVMSDLGNTPSAIGKLMDRSNHTVAKYLKSDVYDDPTIYKIVEKIKEKSLQDSYLLVARGRKRLHELLDQGDSQMIPTIALVDRLFNQCRLLEGSSTENVDIRALNLEEKDLKRQLEELESE